MPFDLSYTRKEDKTIHTNPLEVESVCVQYSTYDFVPLDQPLYQSEAPKTQKIDLIALNHYMC